MHGAGENEGETGKGWEGWVVVGTSPFICMFGEWGIGKEKNAINPVIVRTLLKSWEPFPFAFAQPTHDVSV